MIESADSEMPWRRRKNRIQLLIRAIKTLIVWALEVEAEALGTSLMVMTGFRFRREGSPWHYSTSLSEVVAGSITVLIVFAITGYLATTLISKFFLSGGRRRWYPYTCAGLYLIHSTIFFSLGSRGHKADLADIPFQFVGACFTWACTWSGTRLLAHWNRDFRT